MRNRTTTGQNRTRCDFRFKLEPDSNRTKPDSLAYAYARAVVSPPKGGLYTLSLRTVCGCAKARPLMCRQVLQGAQAK